MSCWKQGQFSINNALADTPIDVWDYAFEIEENTYVVCRDIRMQKSWEYSRDVKSVVSKNSWIQILVYHMLTV